jgi:excinuclease ABC subunit A
MGLEGGDKGGKIIFEGTPEELAKSKISHTGVYLKKELELAKSGSNKLKNTKINV